MHSALRWAFAGALMLGAGLLGGCYDTYGYGYSGVAVAPSYGPYYGYGYGRPIYPHYHGAFIGGGPGFYGHHGSGFYGHHGSGFHGGWGGGPHGFGGGFGGHHH